MIRKICILSMVVLLFIYSIWNFYAKALLYDPLQDTHMKKAKKKEIETVEISKYNAAWSKDIYEKNLFSPDRTYREKPLLSLPSVPPVEPPKKPDIALKGIILDNYGEYVALLEINKAKAAPMRKGDKIEDVELIDISERSVMLKWNDENMKFSIDRIKTISNPRMNR